MKNLHHDFWRVSLWIRGPLGFPRNSSAICRSLPKLPAWAGSRSSEAPETKSDGYAVCTNGVVRSLHVAVGLARLRHHTFPFITFPWCGLGRHLTSNPLILDTKFRLSCPGPKILPVDQAAPHCWLGLDWFGGLGWFSFTFYKSPRFKAGSKPPT